MKEAIGELNMTVVVVIVVAALSLFFFSYLWPIIRGNMAHDVGCEKAICECPNKGADGNCIVPSDGMVDCHLPNENEIIRCVWKG